MKRIILLLSLISFSTLHSQSGWITQNFPQRDFRSVNFLNSQTGFIISSKGYIEKTTNSGLNWTELSTGLPGGGNSLGSGFFSTLNLGSLNSYVGIFTTSNGGANWINSYPSGKGLVSIKTSLYINDTIGFACGNDFIFDKNIRNNTGTGDEIFTDYAGVVYKTTDRGMNWNTIFRQYSTVCVDFYAKSTDSISVLAFTFLRTTNGGVNWSSSDLDVTPAIYPRSFTNPYKDTIFICADAGRIVKSTNAGINWSYAYSNPQYYNLNKISFINSKTGYCVGDSGIVLYTSNAGETWLKQNTNTKQRLWDIFPLNKDTIYIVGDSGTVLRTYTGGLVSVPNYSINIPSKFSLSQNFPNPFNPLTRINYELQITNYVILNVYDVNGRLVKELVNKKQSVGNYSIDFDGSGLPSGTYVYRLQAGDFSETKKMVLLK
ncbi:MAG: T9SS type A sorting domain-containing protein [Ignavibacteria bacterium]|nr:T9SS type A sorting domain-containing protein [Ignavibacteria bacterium]